MTYGGRLRGLREDCDCTHSWLKCFMSAKKPYQIGKTAEMSRPTMS